MRRIRREPLPAELPIEVVEHLVATYQDAFGDFGTSIARVQQDAGRPIHFNIADLRIRACAAAQSVYRHYAHTGRLVHYREAMRTTTNRRPEVSHA